MEYKIEKLVITDLRDVEEIGKISLPIYYKLSDLIYIFFDYLGGLSQQNQIK